MSVALVTGAGRGIGLAIAERLAKDGFDLCIVARSGIELDLAADQIRNLGVKCDRHVLDISDRSAVAGFCGEWQHEISVLVNNAGTVAVQPINDGLSPFDDSSGDAWRHILSTNLDSVYWLTKGLIGHVSDGGRIVNISSQLGQEGRRGYGAYCASKFGLIGLTKCWAKELGARRITANVICPGWVRTALAVEDTERLASEAGVSYDEYMREIVEPIELGRWSEPQEVASLVSFLCSADGAGISGRDWLMHTIWNQL